MEADLDVYRIGLTQMAKMPHSDITVEVSKSCSDEAKFIHINNLIRFLQTDPDLAEILTPSHDVTTHLFISSLGHLRGHKHLWLKGASAGGGWTCRCSCQRKDRICGPSCQCINSLNTCTPTQPPTNQSYVSELETLDLLNKEHELEEEYSQNDDLNDLREDRETEDIMCFVLR